MRLEDMSEKDRRAAGEMLFAAYKLSAGVFRDHAITLGFTTIESALVLVREHKARLAADPEVHRQIVEAARVGGIKAAREKATKIIGPQGYLEVMMRALREANCAS